MGDKIMQRQQLSQIPPGELPPSKRAGNRYSKKMRIFIYTFLLFIMLAGGVIAYSYSYFVNNVEDPLSKIFHVVSRSGNEPPPDDSAITGRPWNILLLGSDNDNKYSFPALLTQVMMVVHIDPDNNSVYMVSIPRDSWVYVPENGSMHKIDQAFLSTSHIPLSMIPILTTLEPTPTIHTQSSVSPLYQVPSTWTGWKR